MASRMYTDCSSSTQLPFTHLNHRTGTFLRRPCFDQLRFQTTVPGRGYSLSFRSRSSPILAISAYRKSVMEKIRDETEIELTRMEESIKAFVKRVSRDDALKKDGDEFVTGRTRLAVLAVIIVGNRHYSDYARKKLSDCGSIGIHIMPLTISRKDVLESEEDVLFNISYFNDAPGIVGIIVSFPLPLGMNEEKILNAISIEKKVDGFHPTDFRLLAMLRRREPLFNAAIANECVCLLRRSNIEMKGKIAVVIGWTNNIEIHRKIRVAARMFLKKEGATVFVIHLKTKKHVEIAREADIIITCAMKPNLVRGSWIKPGATIIDFGVNPVEDRNAPDGYRLVGDVCYEEASKVASTIMHCPNGVGEMTTALVLLNICNNI